MNFIMMQQKSDHHLVDPSKNNICSLNNLNIKKFCLQKQHTKTYLHSDESSGQTVVAIFYKIMV